MKALLIRIPLATRWLLAAFAGLAALVAIDVLVGEIHIGILSVIPLLLIGFFGSRRLALVTALLCAAVFAVLDNDILPPMFFVRWTMPTDALFLAVALVAILLTSERLRKSEVAARSDSLTALPNRRSLQERINNGLDRAEKRGKKVALLFVDLDGFKEINDRYGHTVGDHVLQHVAGRLLHAVRAVDTVGRMGGDEFVVLLEDVPDRLHAERVAIGIESVLGAPFSNSVPLPSIGATVGIAMYPSDAQEYGALIEFADRQMYQRKNEKRSAGLPGPSRTHRDELTLELDPQRSETS